jgi:hypothetical protein
MRHLTPVLLALVFWCGPHDAMAGPANDGDASYADDADALKARAENGDSDAQYELGLRYYSGDGVAKDDGEAMSWIREAAEQGEPRAEFALGLAYRKGIGMMRDLLTGTQWISKAAEDGDINAENALSVMYQKGMGGLARDPDASDKWHQAALAHYLQDARKKQEAGEKELRAAFKSAGGGEALQTFDFRCMVPDGEGRAQILLVEVDRDKYTVTERVIDPHDEGKARVNAFENQRLAPLPEYADSSATINESRLENVAFNPATPGGYEIDYGYSGFDADSDGYKVQVHVKNGAITYARALSNHANAQSVHCDAVPAQKVRRFEEKEAGLRREEQSMNSADEAFEEARRRAAWDTFAPEEKQ